MNKSSVKYRAVVQARMLSERLRGKSLMAVSGVPLLAWVLDRVKRMQFLDSIVVATSDAPSDEPLAQFAASLGVEVVRGDKEDVLSRFVAAASDLDESDVILRFTADNPLYDVHRTEAALKAMEESNADYMHIDGLSHMIPEFVRTAALRFAAKNAENSFQREHVTFLLRQKPTGFNVKALPADFAELRPEYDGRLTIDRPDQLEAFESMVADIAPNDVSELELNDCYRWLDEKDSQSVPNALPGQKRMRLAGREVGDGCPCFVIAEIGQNHNGQVNLGKRLIDMAARCGADAVKFQKRDISWELTEEAYNKPYEGPNSFGSTYGIHREFLELDESQHRELKEYAQSLGLIYFCTPCDPPSVDLLERIGNPIYKVASRDITNIPLLRHIARTGKPVIISTGMAGMDDIREALEAFEGSRCHVSLMQCVSQYPAEPKNVNLLAMETMRQEFDVLVALSDHTPGVITGVAGAVMGAFALEKHITLSRAMPGTDHAAALEEEGLKRVVNYIKTCREALGDGTKVFNPVAQSAKDKLARSLVSANKIEVGTELREEHLVLKSPGTGLAWSQRETVLGKKSKVEIPAGTLISASDFE